MFLRWWNPAPSFTVVLICICEARRLTHIHPRCNSHLSPPDASRICIWRPAEAAFDIPGLAAGVPTLTVVQHLLHSFKMSPLKILLGADICFPGVTSFSFRICLGCYRDACHQWLMCAGHIFTGSVIPSTVQNERWRWLRTEGTCCISAGGPDASHHAAGQGNSSHADTSHCSRRRPCFDTLCFFCTSSYIFLLFCYFPSSLNLRNCTKILVCCISTLFLQPVFIVIIWIVSYYYRTRKEKHMNAHTHTHTN